MEMEVFTGVVLLDEQKRIYLIKEDDKYRVGQNRWNLPGGSIDAGEGMIEAAQREVLEETGYQAEIDSVLGLYQGSKGKDSWFFIVLGAKVKKAKRQPTTDPSVKQGRWFKRNEFLRLKQADLVHSDIKLVYQAAIAKRGLVLRTVKTINYDQKNPWFRIKLFKSP